MNHEDLRTITYKSRFEGLNEIIGVAVCGSGRLKRRSKANKGNHLTWTTLDIQRPGIGHKSGTTVGMAAVSFSLGVDTSYLLMLYLQVKVEEADKDTHRFQRLLWNLQFGEKSGRIV